MTKHKPQPKRLPQPKRRTRPEFPSWIPAHLGFEEKALLLLRERDAVKKAERMVDGVRFRAREELLATPFEQRVQTIGVAQVVARAAAREDFRRQALAD